MSPTTSWWARLESQGSSPGSDIEAFRSSALGTSAVVDEADHQRCPPGPTLSLLRSPRARLWLGTLPDALAGMGSKYIGRCGAA